MALSGEPVVASALLKPLAMAVNAMSTPTTSAMPPRASSVTFQRTMTLRMLYEIGSAIRPASASR